MSGNAKHQFGNKAAGGRAEPVLGVPKSGGISGNAKLQLGIAGGGNPAEPVLCIPKKAAWKRAEPVLHWERQAPAWQQSSWGKNRTGAPRSLWKTDLYW